MAHRLRSRQGRGPPGEIRVMNEKDGATVTRPRWMRQESGVEGGSAGVGGFGLGGEEVGVRLVGEESSVGVVG